jgi:HPt (histidine-containing phosphotransfer) domain-containing protein
MSDGSKDIIVEMVDIFKSQIPEFIENMNTFLETKQYDSLASKSHKY